MGKDKTTVSTTTQATPTEAEREMQKLQLEQYKKTVGPQTDVQFAALQQLNNLFTGQPLSPYFAEAGQGISPQTIGIQAAELARTNLPQFQALGIGDGGVAYRELAKDIANQVLFPAEQFNIGAKQNLLNLAFGGQAQVQQPMVAQQNILSNQLAGLRSISQQTTTQAMNPFWKSLQTSAGASLGKGLMFG